MGDYPHLPSQLHCLLKLERNPWWGYVWRQISSSIRMAKTYANWITNVQNLVIDAGFAPKFLNVQLGFDQNLSKFGNIGLIGKPRDSATKIT